jgi:hypothetical protein
MEVDTEFNKRYLNGTPENPHLDFELWQYIERRAKRMGWTWQVYLLAYYSTRSGNLRAVIQTDNGRIERLVNYRDKWEQAQ